MNSTSDIGANSPILLVPYMWIGDFVRCHSVVRLLKDRFPARPIDVLTTTLCAPLLDYMPGVRKGIVVDLPRKQLAFGQHKAQPFHRTAPGMLARPVRAAGDVGSGEGHRDFRLGFGTRDRR